MSGENGYDINGMVVRTWSLLKVKNMKSGKDLLLGYSLDKKKIAISSTEFH